MKRTIYICIFLLATCKAMAQVGEYRNDLSIGFNGGYVMSNVGFVPKVTQSMLGGMTAGVTARYVCEKYFSTICSVQAEVNYVQTGWKEDILDGQDQPCINTVTGLPEQYERNLGYIQISVFAHLAWGRERKGAQFFFQVGPQVGFKISEKTTSNFSSADALSTETERTNPTVAQYDMPVENKFDYGIAGGLGIEYSIPKVGHIQLEGRYYYGLGNIYGDSKKDYFSRSNLSNIVIKMAWLF